MITYFDTSALIKVVIEEDGSDRAAAVWDATDHVVSATLIAVDGRAALAAARRGRRLTAGQYDKARHAYLALLDGIATVQITPELVDAAGDLAESEGLRGYDAVHLAAALEVTADVLCSSDIELCAAALRRGLAVANPIADTI